MEQVIRYLCDHAECKNLPCMTYDDAIGHAEEHLESTDTLAVAEAIWQITTQEI